jgi:sugar-specific transcriptional regulator TrmB
METDFSNRYTNILKPLGLSDYEIRVFITLIGVGPTNYRTLVKESNVPTGKIYQVLSNLESKGFIEADQGSPKLFKAIEPKKAVMRRLRQIEDTYLDLEHSIRDVLQNLQFEYSQKYNAAQGIVTEIIVGSDDFKSLIKENLLKAEDEIFFSSSDLIHQLCLEEIIKNLRLKGISINAICPSLPTAKKSSNGGSNGLLDLGVNARLFESTPSKFIIVDNKSVSIILYGNEEETCIQIQGAALCRVLRESFKGTLGNGGALNQKHKTKSLNLNGLKTKISTVKQIYPAEN